MSAFRMSVLATALTLTVCAPADTPAPAEDAAAATDSPPNVTGDVAPIPCDGLERSILRFEPTREGMRAALGAPDSVITTTEPNRHIDSATDSIFQVRYPGLVVEIRKPQDGADMPTSVRISRTGYIEHAALDIGTPRDRILAALGEPIMPRDSLVIYDCGQHTSQPVIFVTRDGVVNGIIINYYVD